MWRWVVLAAAAGLAVALFAGLRVPQSIHELRLKQERIRQLQVENADLKKANQKRRQRLEELRQNRSQQELEMRRERKMLRQDEKSLVTPGTPSPDPSLH
ncbi:MAG: hypothetical protein FJW34_11460 [Acidobacteria bacterium]|nr:hypothetical protein [Acidobacteriota bacterium]